MVQPLTLLLYKRVMPGSQLANRMQDLGYRVQTLADPAALAAQAEQDKPLLVIADLEPGHAQVCEAIARLRRGEATAHVPVIAIAPARNNGVQEAARAAGATLVVNDQAILVHLDQLVDQALQVD